MSSSFTLRGLYAITDPDLLGGDALFAGVERALRGGAALIQYRDKSAGAAERKQRAVKLKALCDRFGVPLIVNDEVALAHALGVGVHLGRDDGAVSDARRILGPSAIIGMSCYNEIARAEAAAAQGASYVAFGRFFPSRTKPGEIYADLALLAESKRRFAVAVAAIGGIAVDNAAALIKAGADMVAVIGGVFAEKNIEAAANRFADLFEQEMTNHED